MRHANDEEGELHAVECVVGENWVITAHDRPIPVLEEFAARVSGSGDTGSLDGPGFLAALLEWVLGAYTAAFERIEQRLEDFDVQAMRGEGADEDIEQLVAMRQQVGKLRRALAAHRSALVALTHPELEVLGDNDSSERFQSLFARYEATLQEARDVREAIVGSFDVLIARGGHKTNRIMTVLTLTSVILLPGALLAAVMGMNFKVGLFDQTILFWVVVARDHRDRAHHRRHRQSKGLDLGLRRRSRLERSLVRAAEREAVPGGVGARQSRAPGDAPDAEARHGAAVAEHRHVRADVGRQAMERRSPRAPERPRLLAGRAG